MSLRSPLGYVLGHEWMLISQYIKQYLPFILAGGLLAVIGYLFFHFRKPASSLPEME